MIGRRSLLAATLCLLVPQMALAQPDTADLNTGTLQLKALIVGSDLSLKPVPKWTFRIVGDALEQSSIAITTGFDGEAEMVLPAGKYHISSGKPVTFEDYEYSWNLPFSIEQGEVTNLELSNDNALVEVETAAAAHVQLDEGDLYHAVQSSVFKVLSESGHGSGFLVSDQGLIVTNHHVIAQSDYLAVKLDSKHKYPARVIAADEHNDIAVLQVNPTVLIGRVPLVLADDTPETPSCSVGERVVAIGSPLATETILTSGLVSKVKENVIYSDVNINPGNSGGPLFTMRKEVVGLNTFGLGGASGPGVAGVVRIHLARKLLAGLENSADLGEYPPATELPVESEVSFPADELREAAMAATIDPREYHIEAGKFDVQLITPVVIAGLEVSAEKAATARRGKRTKKKSVKAYKVGQDFYAWRQYAGDYRAVVTIQAVPEITLTSGSAFAVALAGNNAQRKYKFKADFDRMELWRGSTLVQPIHPGRLTNILDVEAGMVSMHDVGFYGSYKYPPEAFAPGELVTLKVWKQGSEKPIVDEVPEELRHRVWGHFEAYFEELEESPGEE